MSDERKPLEPTHEQAVAMVDAVNRLSGIGETMGMHVAMLLWPLIRDYALEAAVSKCEALKDEWVNGCAGDGCGSCIEAIRAMKGDKP